MKVTKRFFLSLAVLLLGQTVYAASQLPLGISLAGNIENRKWSYVQTNDLRVAPFTSTYSYGSFEFDRLGFGAAFSIESRKQGISFGVHVPLYWSTIQKAKSGAAGATEVSGFKQNEFSIWAFPELNFRIGPIAPFLTVGYGISYAMVSTLNDVDTIPRYTRLAHGLSGGGGLKIFIGDYIFVRGAYTYYFLEQGFDLSNSEVINNVRYSVDRTLKSGSNIMFSVGFIFGGAAEAKNEAAPAPAPAEPAKAEEPKPAAPAAAQPKKK